MSISLLGCAEGIRDLITARSESAVGFAVPDIAAMIPMIAEDFARVIAKDPDRRDLLKPAVPFSGTITGGVYDLATNIVAPDLWMLEFFDLTEFRKDPDDLGTAFHLLQETGQLRMKRPTDAMFISAAIDGSMLYTRNTDGALDANIGAITISGPFIPVIAESAASTTLPFALQGQFLQFGAMKVVAGMPNGKK